MTKRKSQQAKFPVAIYSSLTQKLSYDPWGRLRDSNTQVAYTPDSLQNKLNDFETISFVFLCYLLSDAEFRKNGSQYFVGRNGSSCDGAKIENGFANILRNKFA